MLILIIDPKTWSSNGGGEFGALCALCAPVSQLSKEIIFHLLLHPVSKAAKSLIQTLIHTTSEMIDSATEGLLGDLAHLGKSSQDERLHKALSSIRDSFVTSISMSELA